MMGVKRFFIESGSVYTRADAAAAAADEWHQLGSLYMQVNV